MMKKYYIAVFFVVNIYACQSLKEQMDEIDSSELALLDQNKRDLCNIEEQIFSLVSRISKSELVELELADKEYLKQLNDELNHLNLNKSYIETHIMTIYTNAAYLRYILLQQSAHNRSGDIS